MIAEFESRILALIDNMVDHASDDELFAGGYLRGHLTLAVAELEGEGEHSAEAVNSKVSQSLEKAISAGELSPPDQILVQGMWHNRQGGGGYGGIRRPAGLRPGTAGPSLLRQGLRGPGRQNSGADAEPEKLNKKNQWLKNYGELSR